MEEKLRLYYALKTSAEHYKTADNLADKLLKELSSEIAESNESILKVIHHLTEK